MANYKKISQPEKEYLQKLVEENINLYALTKKLNEKFRGLY